MVPKEHCPWCEGNSNILASTICWTAHKKKGIDPESRVGKLNFIKKSCHKINIIKVSEAFHASTPLLTADFLVIRILCSPSSENHSNKWQNIPSKHLTIAFFHRAAAFPERSANGMGTAQRNDTLIIETHPDGYVDSGWLLWIPAVLYNFLLS